MRKTERSEACAAPAEKRKWKNGTDMDMIREEILTALPNKHCSGHLKVTEEGDQRMAGIDVSGKKCEQVSGAAW